MGRHLRSAARPALVASAYALAVGGLLLLGGRLAGLYAHRRAFVAGLALFGPASP
ncbi:hypothetical protein ACQP1W_14485 [Spirillospora sp. CA-255316]